MDVKRESDDEAEDTTNIIINEKDGLPNVHPNYEEIDFKEQVHGDIGAKTLEELIHDEDLPTSVIVTNVDPRIFKSDELKVKTISN